MSAAPRIAAAAGALPAEARPFLWADLLDTYEYLRGRVPYWEVPFYWPPLVGYVAAALVKTGVGAAGTLVAWALLVAAASGVVGFVLARAAGARAAIVCWAAAPQLLLFAGINFDALAVMFAVVGVWLAAAHPAAALVALAVGTCVKVFPALLAPLELDRRRGDRGRLARGALLFVAVVGAISLPSLLAPAPSTYTAPDYASKVTIESVWGLAHALLTPLSLHHLLGPLTVAGLVATYALGVVPAARRAADPAIGAGLAVITLLLWSRIYQPQYSLWVLPFFALAHVPYRWLGLLTVADVGVFVAIMLIEAAGLASPPVALLGLLAATVSLRHAALIGAWVVLYRKARPLAAGAMRSGAQVQLQQ